MSTQPFRYPVQATASATGAATFTFPVTPQGFVAEGSVSVVGASNAVVLVAQLNGQEIGTWGGSATWGPFSVASNEVFTVVASGMLAAQQLQAVWVGLVLPESQSSYPYPAPAGSPPGPNSVLVSQVTETIGPQFCETVLAPTSATALQLYAGFVSGTGLASVQVKGIQSEINYSNGFQVVPNAGLTVPVNTAVDTSYQVCWNNFSGTGTAILTVAALLSSIGAGTNVNVTVTTTGGGMLAYGIYNCTNNGTTGTMTWTAVSEVGAVMLQADTMTFDFPTGSVVLATLDVSVQLGAGASHSFVDTATGDMGATADNTAGLTAVGIGLSASYPFDQSLTASTQFTAADAGGPAFNNGAVLTLAAFTRP